MLQTLQSGSFHAKPRALRVRIWAAVFLLLFGVISQALHQHGTFGKPAGKASLPVIAAAESDADTCPLCVAMHAASPAPEAAVLATPVPVYATYAAISVQAEARPVAFAHRIRPPPAL